MDKILVVDDEKLVRDFLVEALQRKNYEVWMADNGKTALNLLRETHFDLVITDLKLPDINGLEVLKAAKELYPATVVIVITAFGSIENAVQAMQMGAYNYLLKPFSLEVIEALISKACEHTQLIEENVFLRSSGQGEVIAASPAMQQMLKDVARIAPTDATVFIQGESGTGKEVIAQAIHSQSRRADKPFIKVNCAAIPETLIESEFFGHEKGAFTGATTRRQGRFELAHGGTLLLDEVTEIPVGLQAKLLRVLQEHEFERIGGSKPIKVDVRIISTSNRDIQAAIASKVLREDLYYRLNVVPLHLTPLRERKEDILPLAHYFLSKSGKTFTKAAEQKLLGYSWPGNTRELSNIIERATLLAPEKIIGEEHLTLDEGKGSSAHVHIPLGTTLKELEKRYILETLLAHQDDKKKAAEALGITLRTLNSKIGKS